MIGPLLKVGARNHCLYTENYLEPLEHSLFFLTKEITTITSLPLAWKSKFCSNFTCQIILLLWIMLPFSYLFCKHSTQWAHLPHHHRFSNLFPLILSFIINSNYCPTKWYFGMTSFQLQCLLLRYNVAWLFWLQAEQHLIHWFIPLFI